MNKNNMILHNIGQLVTPIGTQPVRGKDMSYVRDIKNAEVVIKDGKILYAGAAENSPKSSAVFDGDKDFTAVDCGGMAVLPGFVDSHTHLVFGGHRAEEFGWRQSGQSYMDILQKGGGILSTVRATQSATEDELVKSALPRLDELRRCGVTTAEIKSGYGLDTDTELKQLRAINRLSELCGMDIVATFMGAHAVPPEYKGRGGDYIDHIISEILPKVKKQNLARFVDVFCEKGVFGIEESRRLLKAAMDMGFGAKIHADEIVTLGGTELAAEIGCVSADHLLAASNAGINALAKSGTVATLLPLTAFCLKEPYADARRMIDSGCAVSLATDFNPGSCFSSSVPLMIALAVIYMRMSAAEVVSALTLNAACALDLGCTHGSLEVGKTGDLVVLKYPSIDYLAYHSGVNCVRTVVKNGRIIAQNE